MSGKREILERGLEGLPAVDQIKLMTALQVGESARVLEQYLTMSKDKRFVDLARRQKKIYKEVERIFGLDPIPGK
ncbi:MAG: hypothetical protein F4Y18_03505 [Cenarchaeum sp. SB0663_bin_5]|nr:hypothetical protein [Cenarchaeum sp. SB0663_bin_5]MYL11738.1 hypothetical protein [Cenarchaeum sp. SB0669_bin_11]